MSLVTGNVYIGAETVPKVADSKLGIRENASVDKLAVDDPVFGKIEGNKFEESGVKTALIALIIAGFYVRTGRTTGFVLGKLLLAAIVIVVAIVGDTDDITFFI